MGKPVVSRQPWPLPELCNLFREIKGKEEKPKEKISLKSFSSDYEFTALVAEEWAQICLTVTLLCKSKLVMSPKHTLPESGEASSCIQMRSSSTNTENLPLSFFPWLTGGVNWLLFVHLGLLKWIFFWRGVGGLGHAQFCSGINPGSARGLNPGWLHDLTAILAFWLPNRLPK